MRTFQSLALLALAASAIACGAEPSGLDEATYSSGGELRQVGRFTGMANPSANEWRVWSVPMSVGPRAGSVVEQGAWGAVPVEAPDGNGTSVDPGTVQLRNDPDAPPADAFGFFSDTTNNCNQEQTRFLGDVFITNNTGMDLPDVYARIDGGSGFANVCHEAVDAWPDPGLPGGGGLGLFRWGNVDDQEEVSSFPVDGYWIFAYPGGTPQPFTFSGSIWANLP